MLFWNADETELDELNAAKWLLSDTSGGAFDENVYPVRAADCFDGGFGMTGSGGPMTDDDDMLFERLEQELDCDASEGDV